MSLVRPWMLADAADFDPKDGAGALAEEVYCPAVPQAEREAMEAQVYVLGSLHEAMRSRLYRRCSALNVEELNTSTDALDALQDVARHGSASDEQAWLCARADVSAHLWRRMCEVHHDGRPS